MLGLSGVARPLICRWGVAADVYRLENRENQRRQGAVGAGTTSSASWGDTRNCSVTVSGMASGLLSVSSTFEIAWWLKWTNNGATVTPQNSNYLYSIEKNGAVDRIRTYDRLITNQLIRGRPRERLEHSWYRGFESPEGPRDLVGAIGFEPATNRLNGALGAITSGAGYRDGCGHRWQGVLPSFKPRNLKPQNKSASTPPPIHPPQSQNTDCL